MTRMIIAAFCGAAALAAANSASAYSYDYHTAVQRVVVTVSCYRGPWDDVIWDRPNPVFVDSLVSASYSFP